MTPERWRQIEELFHSVREGSADQRAELLAQADPELRREVESLLRRENDSLPSLDIQTMTRVQSGTRLGPYQVESKLGEGGMGEVFRAIDTRLGRPVAIKVVHQHFNARFEREARAISSLNHPHICTLYDIGPNYLVMELLDGETLAARLKSGPLPIDEALRFASQIAAALADAHEHGIVHRDLKPGNIMLTKAGAKVLDFGLATLEGDDTLTASRMVMGTPAYMAPEQREGKQADARTDIYSFGRVLYEMLTGTRATSESKPLPVKPLEQVVSRCLEVDPARRWQTSAELLGALEATRMGGATLAKTSRTWIVAAAILAIALIAGYFVFRSPRKLTEKDTIVLADFDNKTGDPVFDDTLRQGLSVELQQSPFLNLVSDAQVQRTLTLMGQPKQTRLTLEIAQQICERTGSALVLEGSIASLGSEYVLGLRAKNCNTGNILDQEQAVAAKREDVLNSLSDMSRKFRTRVGESLATVEKHSTPLAEATTTSLEALKAYSIGMKVVVASGSAEAVPFYHRAIEIDPKFAMAYALLGVWYSGIGESVLSVENTTKAWQLRDHVSDRERFYIDFTYDREVTGNLEKAYQTLESWYRTYPRGENPNAQGFLSGLATHGTGRYERAIEMSQKRIATSPDEVFGYGSLAYSYFLLDRFPEAESTLQRASERKLENPNMLMMRYNIAVLKGDKGQTDRVVALAKGKREAEHRVAHGEALALARSGRLQAARRLSSRAVDLALQEGEPETAASYQAARAVWESICGNAVEGKRNAVAALAVSHGRDVEYAVGLALALSGDSSRAQPLADDLEKRFPEDTFAKFTYVPVLHGLASLERGKPVDSEEDLQNTLQYELAVNGLNFNHWYLGGLHSAYVRGEALIAMRRYTEAVAEFQKILEHRGIVGLDPIGVLAHLQLGRAFSLSGDNTKAKAAYQEFLTLWKDADPDIPVLQQARTEYSKL